MTRHLLHLRKLRAAIQGAPAVPSRTVVDDMIFSMERKARFAEMQLALIVGIEWDSIEGVGRRHGGVANPAEMSIKLADASIVFHHSEAVVDYAYLAFDGLIAAVVNSTDTLAHLINLSYNLRIGDRGATLFKVRNRCAPTSPLGTILNDARYMGWLDPLRKVRGQCQHANVEGVLRPVGAYGRRGQPAIDGQFSWSVPPTTTPLVSYSQAATTAAEDCMIAVVDAIADCAPSSPI